MAPPADNPDLIRCEVTYARPERQWVIALTLPTGATAAQCLLRSGIMEECPEIDPSSAVLGIYGRKVDAEYPMQDGDRLEIYRPLGEDPRIARRQRVKAARHR